jgi:peptide/nickel transport system permease protein
MTNYLIRRLFQMVIVVFLSTVAIYVMLNIAPGGPLSGIRLSADRKSRVSDADIARLKSYLGLDKPLALRYITWVIGDDWIGANWMYAGAGRYQNIKIGAKGEPIVKVDRETGAEYYDVENVRFWTDAGTALYNPGYELWVFGPDAGINEARTVIETPEGQEVKMEQLQTYTAESVIVKPPHGESAPEDVAIVGLVLSQEGNRVIIEALNGQRYLVVHSAETAFTFPTGEGLARPTEGNWINISWLTGADGMLNRWAGFNGDTHGILRLDFGFSWRVQPGQPVIDLFRSRLGNTIILMTTATLVSIVIGIPIGIYSAVNQYSKTDYAVTTFAFFGSAMPVFWFGLMMILLFSVQFSQWELPFLPTGGVASVRTPAPGSLLGLMGATPGSLVDRGIHLLLPTMVLSLLYLASWSRYSRSSMLEVLRQDYVRTARAKGLIERFVILKHALRNALIPIVTILVFDVAGIFSGAILTETIFAYPGMGGLYFDALGGNDWPVVMAFLYISAILVVIATLVRDVLYTVVDPRIRFS